MITQFKLFESRTKGHKTVKYDVERNDYIVYTYKDRWTHVSYFSIDQIYGFSNTDDNASFRVVKCTEIGSNRIDRNRLSHEYSVPIGVLDNMNILYVGNDLKKAKEIYDQKCIENQFDL